LFSGKSNTRINNVLIFNPQTETQTYLFERNTIWDIKTFTFEANCHDSRGIEFFGSITALNNPKNITRELNNKLLVVTSEKDSDTLTMWFASKSGKNLSAIHTFNKSVKWHIDIKNSKVSFISSHNEVTFKAITW